MRTMLADPNYAVTPGFLNALAILESPFAKNYGPINEREQQIRTELSQIVPNKRGLAFVRSAQTWLSGTNASLTAPQVGQLLEIFPQLPDGEKASWLGPLWNQVSDPRWLPILQTLATRPIDMRRQTNLDFAPDVIVARLAYQYWYLLDPIAARPAILYEITRPTPALGADPLGILPDQMLPTEQFVIANNLVNLEPPKDLIPTSTNKSEYLHRYDRLAAYTAAQNNLTSLLSRYCGKDVLPQVVPTINQNFAQFPCQAQQNAITFLQKQGVTPPQLTPNCQSIR